MCGQNDTVARERTGMQRIIVFLAAIAMCTGCSGSQASAPDYEIRSEQEKDVSNLKTKTITVSTESIKEQKLRQIATDIKGDNTGDDALRIHFQRDTQGKSAPQEKGMPKP
jgi:ABC-type glycerol-3-phosphate transport system substrate-binding protein